MAVKEEGVSQVSLVVERVTAGVRVGVQMGVEVEVKQHPLLRPHPHSHMKSIQRELLWLSAVPKATLHTLSNFG